MPLTSLPVSELVRRIHSRELSPFEVVDAHIKRIEAVNPKLNALAAARFEKARHEANMATEACNRLTELPPLYGIPFTVKEFFQAEGMPWTGAVSGFAGRLAPKDSTVVKRLKAAGAILIGSTNAPEGGLWMETYNDIYGRTSNPWDVRRTSGGSSGGEGALVASGGSPFGIGSDVGGSIRIPAAFCGVPAHKPSGRRVPGTGHFPEDVGGTGPFLGFGPMSRRVRDLSLLVDLISGPDGVDLHCKPMKPIGTLPEGDLKGIRVISLPGNGRTKIAPYMKKAILDSARALEERGATIEDREFPRLKKGLEIWSAMLSEHSTHSYDELLTDGAGISWWREVLKLPFRRSAHTFAGLVMVGLDRLLEKLPLPHQQFIEDATLLQQELEEAMGPDGVLLHPSWSKIAPFHHRSWLTPFDFVCTAVFNVLEFPATVVPVAREQGMPVSVQVVGPREGDARTLRVAAALEDAFGPWQQAPVEGL